MKGKIHYGLQCAFQVAIYLVEVIIIPLLAVLVSKHFLPIGNFMQGIQRWLTFYAIYQVLVIVIATNINDIHRDSWLAAKDAYTMAKYYCDTNDADILPMLNQQLNRALDEKSVISPEAKCLILALGDIDKNQVERALILINHQLATCDLKWRYSLILRHFK